MNSPLTESDLQHIGESILAGNKVEAIQRCRKVTRAGLAESKRAVEEMEEGMRVTTPERFFTSDAIKVRRQKRFFVFYCFAAIFMAICAVRGTMRFARGEMTSWVTVSMPWIATLCFIGAANSIRRSAWGPPRGR